MTGRQTTNSSRPPTPTGGRGRDPDAGFGNPRQKHAGYAATEGYGVFPRAGGYGVDRKQKMLSEKIAYITTFCEHIATVQRASRPRTIPLLKSYYSTYRETHPVMRLSPASLVYDLRAKRRVVKFTNYENKVIEWTEALSENYGPSQRPANEASKPTHRENEQAEPSAKQQISKVESILLNSSREELEKNKNYVEIANIQELFLNHCSSQGLNGKEVDFESLADGDGTVVVSQSHSTLSIIFQVRNKRNGSTQILKPPYFLVGSPGLEIQSGRSADKSTTNSPIVLEAAGIKFFTFKFTPKVHGLVKDTVVFDFNDFVICRYISIRVEDSDVAADMRKIESKPAVSQQNLRRPKPKVIAAKIVSAPKVSKPAFSALPIALGKYEIPKAVRDRFEERDDDDVFDEDEMILTPETYRNVFETLQQVEEIQMGADIRKYDLIKTQLRLTQSGKMALIVRGLAERRPNVMYGDKIYVRKNGYGDVEYEGRVDFLHGEEIQVLFDPTFVSRVWMQNMEFDVRFTFSRTPLRRAYQALALTNSVPSNLKFPSESPRALQTRPNPYPLDMNSPGMRDLNEEQKMAIQNIVEQQHGTVPYIIFGPPGTGKTRCMVECIRQVHNCYKNSAPRISVLALAPSNLAADQLVERLSKSGFTMSEMLRLHSYQRPVTDLSKLVLDYSVVRRNTDGFDTFPLLSGGEIMRHKVIVTTCITGGLLYSSGIPRGHFTHIFMDEAGQATEPEFWISVAGLVDAKTKIILAGDPKQLGPTLRSVIAKKHGLETSYMERLMSLPFYAQADASKLPRQSKSTLLPSQYYVNPTCITKLVRNYRSHPRILSISSSLFYNGEQVAAADKQMRESFEDWDGLPSPGFPIIFQGVQGRDMQEGDSPSWYNPDECGLVKKWVEKVFKARGKGVSGDQIGIITPYRRQVQKIETLLKGYGCKVASVEEFQVSSQNRYIFPDLWSIAGQERRIIIISTVRSSASFVAHDMMHNLGFLQNKKRFNVAISRAKALLIVIGNPSILEKDPYWGALVKYCRASGSLIGFDPIASENSKFLDPLSRLRMAEEKSEEEEIFTIMEGENDGTGVGQITAQEDPAWDFRACEYRNVNNLKLSSNQPRHLNAESIKIPTAQRCAVWTPTVIPSSASSDLYQMGLTLESTLARLDDIEAAIADTQSTLTRLDDIEAAIADTQKSLDNVMSKMEIIRMESDEYRNSSELHYKRKKELAELREEKVSLKEERRRYEKMAASLNYRLGQLLDADEERESQKNVATDRKDKGFMLVDQTIDTCFDRNQLLRAAESLLPHSTNPRKCWTFSISGGDGASPIMANLYTAAEGSSLHKMEVDALMTLVNVAGVPRIMGTPQLNKTTLCVLYTPLCSNITDKKQMLHCLISVVGILRSAHSRGLVYRDISPRNVVISEKLETHLLNWGCAAPVGSVQRFRGATSFASGRVLRYLKSGISEFEYFPEYDLSAWVKLFAMAFEQCYRGLDENVRDWDAFFGRYHVFNGLRHLAEERSYDKLMETAKGLIKRQEEEG
ncbi:hypothetical protein HDU67_002270 [Dinochytrium kinnereticum]|nr:hypothetical protein HDU67_002270 [Dinochytrium kinnereticum]